MAIAAMAATGFLAASACLSRTALAAPEGLSLEKAIKKAIELNPSLRSQEINLKQSEINYRNSWDSMYLPSVTLDWQANSDFSIGGIGPIDKRSEPFHGYPSRTVALTLGRYSVFNFWRDWSTFEQARVDWVRNQEIYQEFVRSTRFNTIKAYFYYRVARDKLDASEKSRQVADAILTLLKSRRLLNKATPEQVSSAELDLIQAKNEYNMNLTAERSALWALNQALGDPIGTSYLLQDAIRFVPLRIRPDEILKIYQENAPNSKNYRKEIRKAELAYELEQKSRLPLPQVSFSGLTLSYGTNYAGTLPDLYSQSSGQTQLNISASISLSLPLVGPGGLLGSRKVEAASLNLDSRIIQQREGRLRDETTALQLWQQIQQSEESVANYKQSLHSATLILDGVFKQLTHQRTVERLEIKDALRQVRESQLNLSDAMIQHLSAKLDLAQLIGVDKLPGEL